MTHKFDFKNRAKLSGEERQKILPAKEILEKTGIKSGDIIADIGCGIGYFTFPAAEIAGSAGKVYALDISQDMLDALEDLAKEKHQENINRIKTSENNLIIDDNSVDHAFACNVLHEVNNLDKMLEEIKRVMSSGSKLTIVEWKKSDSKIGPEKKHRLRQEVLAGKIQKKGFVNIVTEDYSEFFYLITANKE